MAIGLLQSVTALMAACTKHVSRATKKLRIHPSLSKLDPRSRKVPLLSRRVSFIPFLGAKKKIAEEKNSKIAEEEEESEEESEEDEEERKEAVWRRTILMGEKCQPLDFSGVIYYDNAGKQVSEIPTPRSPLRGGGSPLHSSFSFHPVIVQENNAMN